MNRLQKKCVIVTVGIHLLLLAILIFGPAFYNRTPKNDNQILDVIPANIVDAALNSGVRNAQPPPPAPAPAVIPPSELRPPPPLAAPAPPKVVQPAPAPAPTPAPSFLKEVERYFRSEKQAPAVKPNLKPVEHSDRTSRSESNHTKITVNLTRVTRTSQRYAQQTENSQNTRAYNNALRSLSQSLSSATKVELPGNADASFANYASVVQSVYEQALRPNLPEMVANNNETTRVSITVASDGTVISARIISPSGDSSWDTAVQRTLDQVTSIAPFPSDWTEKERHFTLSFNPQVERSFE